MFGILKKTKKRFSAEEADKLNEFFREFRDILPKNITEAHRLCASGQKDKGLDLLMSCLQSGIPIVGFSDPMMLAVVSELSLHNYDSGNTYEGLHFETLRWIIHLRSLGLSDSKRASIWSGADSALCPDADVREYHAKDDGEWERIVERQWKPADPDSMEA